MRLHQLWLTGLVRPSRAFDEVGRRSGPSWGFGIVLVFNLLISTTTLLSQHLLGRRPLMESSLTFLPTESYYVPEMFFLPVLRIMVWLMGSAVTHLALRLAKKESDFDRILNIGGMGYLMVMPLVLVSDWIFIGFNVYHWVKITHPLIVPWGVFLTAVGLHRLLNVRIFPAVLLGVFSEAVSIPLLALLAR